MWFRWIFILLPIATFTIQLEKVEEEKDKEEDPPCTAINQLCTCSHPGPTDFGRVTCSRVPFDTIDIFNNNCRVYILRLEHNNLINLGNDVEGVDKSPLANTGIRHLSINYNHITRVSQAVFKGLERSLRELNLAHNHIHQFPGSAIRHLYRLQKLDLTNNKLATLLKEDLVISNTSLEELILKNNQLVHLPVDIFSNLCSLKTLDLSGNRLSFISYNLFSSAHPQLSFVDLSNNQLRSIPFGLMVSLQGVLKTIDLSNNLIRSTHDIDDLGMFPSTHQGAIRIEDMKLDNNRIQKLPAGAFRFFASIGKLSLDFNQIETIDNGAFWSTKLQELSIRSCYIKQLAAGSFRGLEGNLRSLDMSQNNIDSEMAANVLTNLTALQKISLIGTNVGLLPSETFAQSRHTLQSLRLESSGNWENTGGAMKLTELQKLRNIRVLGMAQFPTTSLSGFEFKGQSSTIEIMSFRGSNIRALEADAFRYLAGLRTLDLSSNHLDYVHSNTFRTIGHSLETLLMSNSFISSIHYLPNGLFQPLVNIRHISLNNNHLTYLDVHLFEKNFNLIILNLEDNFIEDITPGTFSGDLQFNLRTIRLSFNRIYTLKPQTFADFDHLKRIDLNDNRITTINKNAFVNINQLQHINLKGNRLTTIEIDALQNMPRLSHLDLSYNQLETFNFDILDQLGALATLKVNVSHNGLTQLRAQSHHSHINLKLLDLSFNSLTEIDEQYFEPVKTSLMQLILSHNRITNITKNVIQRMARLQTLHLDNNRINEIHSDAFSRNIQLQLINLHHNMLTKLPMPIFSSCLQLRRLDLSKNRLNELPEHLFHNNDILEHLNLASNRLSAFPTNVLLPLASTIHSIDLSENHINQLTPFMLQKFTRLLQLDISSNRIYQIDVNQLLQQLTSIISLSLSNNPLTVVESVHSQTLEQLYLEKISLTQLPILVTPKLLRLDVSKNVISNGGSADVFKNATDIRELNIKNNRLSHLNSEMWSPLHRLDHLNLAYNPLSNISNSSFFNFRLLNTLEIQGIALQSVLGHLKCLRSLTLDHHSSIVTMQTISELLSLEELTLHVKNSEPFALKRVQGHALPPKLRTINLADKQMSKFAYDAFQAFINPNLTLRLHYTATTHLSPNIFNDNIRQLQLDLSNNNLATIEDMVTAERPGAQGLFLMDIRLQNNLWKCDSCETMGWVENWLKQLRQEVCNHESSNRCLQIEDELRVSRCDNHRPILEVLKNDYDCHWKSQAKIAIVPSATLIVTMVMLLISRL